MACIYSDTLPIAENIAYGFPSGGFQEWSNANNIDTFRLIRMVVYGTRLQVLIIETCGTHCLFVGTTTLFSLIVMVLSGVPVNSDVSKGNGVFCSRVGIITLPILFV